MLLEDTVRTVQLYWTVFRKDTVRDDRLSLLATLELLDIINWPPVCFFARHCHNSNIK